MNQYKQNIGDFGQQLAGQFLISKQHQILEEKYYTRLGEIDIIAEKNNQLLFIEVKTRTSEKFGRPEEAVSQSKKEKMNEAVLQYLSENNINHDNYRLDIIAVLIDKGEMVAKIRHLKNVF